MKIKLFFIFLTSFFLTSCSPQSRYIMPPLKYHDSISVHVPKNAYLLWQHGQDLAGETPSFSGNDLILSVIEAQDRKNNPSRYHFSFGKAEQAAFITNVKEVLTDHQVFKQIELIANLNQAKSNGVLIEIKFKTTRVSGFERNYKITLTVEMKIKSGKSNFIRTYMAESDEGDFFHGKSYSSQVADVSEQMLKELIKGIEQWSKK